MADFVENLVDMGFAREKAQKAVDVTGNKGVEPAMEWLLANNDFDVGSAPTAAGSNAEVQTSKNEGGESTADSKSDVVRSYKCDDCGKTLRNAEEMEYHAAKTTHSNFSESNEEKKPLTAEEKSQQLKRIEEKLKQKKAEREEREKKDEIDREKLRMKTGKELAEAKRRLEQQEMKEIAEARRREKIEDKQARDRVKAKIEDDKAARKAKFGASVSTGSDSTVLPVPTVSTSSKASEESVPQPKKDYKETKLQLRLPNGKTLIQTFGCNEPLAAVRVFVEMNRDDGLSGPFNLMTSFPRRLYQGEDFDIPLEALGLVPSAVMMVTKTV